METLKRFIKYWFLENLSHAIHGTEKKYHMAVFLIVIAGTILPLRLLNEESMTHYVHWFAFGVLGIDFLLWIPFRRHSQKEEELAKQSRNSDDAIAKLTEDNQSLKNNKPSLEIHWHTDKPCLERDGETFYCRLQIENTSNAPAQNVEVNLMSVSPPPPSEWTGSFPMRLLPRSKQQDTINPKSKVYFNLLSVNRRPGRMGIIFSEIEGRTEWFETEFIQQSRRFQDYVLEISVASLNSAPVTERFKLVLLGDVSLTRMS